MMKIKLFHKTKDSDLEIGMQVCYKDIDGNYSKLGIITDIVILSGVYNYLINTAFGSYTAIELKLIEE